MRHSLAILISIFVLIFSTDAFAYRGMGCDSSRRSIDRDSESTDTNNPTDGSDSESFTPPGNSWNDSQNQDEASQIDQEIPSRPNRPSGEAGGHRDCSRDDTSADGTNPWTPPDDAADGGTNPWTPPDDATDGGTNPWTPPDDAADGGTNPWTPPDDATDGGTNPWTPPDDATDGGTNPWTPPDNATDDDTNSNTPADDASEDNSGSDDTATFESGTLTISGSGFGDSEGLQMGLLCFPVDTEIDPSNILQLVNVLEGAMLVKLQADGSIVNAIAAALPTTLVDLTLTATADLSGGEHLVVAVIDNSPSITDFTGFSDIGDNDMVAYTTVQIDGDTSFNLDYSALIWIPFGNL